MAYGRDKTYEMNRFLIHRAPELRHHGIKGMLWGKRNGHPYPLDYSDRSAREKQAMTKSQKEKAKEKPSKSTGKILSVDKKKLIKAGAIAAGVGLAAIGGYALYKSGALNKIVNSGKEFVKNDGILGAELPKNNMKMPEAAKTNVNDIAARLKTTVADASKAGLDLDGIRNLDYINKINEVGGSDNCSSTTLAYIANRLFGGNFKAVADNMLTDDQKTVDYMKSLFKDGTIKEIDPESRLGAGANGSLMNKKLVDLIPNGSTGALALNFTKGHWVNYEKTSDGKFTLVCNQNRRIVPLELLGKLIEKIPVPYKYCYRILDFTNAEFSEEGLKKLPGLLR